jgi:hypothetical protein
MSHNSTTAGIACALPRAPSVLNGRERSAPSDPDSQPRAPTRPERAASTQAGFASVDRRAATTGASTGTTQPKARLVLAANRMPGPPSSRGSWVVSGAVSGRRQPGPVGAERRGGRHAASGAGHAKTERSDGSG